MKGKYELIALDMDGTLLNSEQKISPRTLEAMRNADQTGKYVTICTGRTPAELTPYQDELLNASYAICENGAMVYDLKNQMVLTKHSIESEFIDVAFELVRSEKAMIIIYGEGKFQMNREDANRMEDFQVEQYKWLALNVGTLHDNIEESYRSEAFSVEKIALYSVDVATRDRLYDKLQELPLTVVYAEQTGIEITALGMSKAIGLRELCEHLGISIEETIVVGDSFNDMEALKAAGLSVAMGNAFPQVKEICDIVVSDHDHDGCAEVIETYLL